MSFSMRVKTELCGVKTESEHALHAQCYGAWLFSRCFTLRKNQFVTENAAVSRKLLELAAEACGVIGELTYSRKKGERTVYRVCLPSEEDRGKLLKSFGATGGEPNLRINRAVLEEEEDIPPFLRGAFLSCGAVTDPNKGYHLQFSVPYETLANSLYTLICEIDILPSKPILSGRKGAFSVCFKDGELIEDFLTYIGAGKASMEVMQARMYRELTNSINRRTNFETANMDRTFSASARQTAAIAALVDSGKYDSLSQDLKDLADFRLGHPQMTSRQIAHSMGSSLSTTVRKLNKLIELGEDLIPKKEN